MDVRTVGARTLRSKAPDRVDAESRPPLVREFLLVAAMYAIYRLGRIVAEGRVGWAFNNAADVWSWERTLHLPDEVDVQRLLLHSRIAVEAANTYYATVHFPATLLVLVWMYVHRPSHYLWMRRVLTAQTAAALALHLLMPLAPPRMLSGVGLIDTGRIYGPSVYGNPHSDTLSNQYAAMPSLHVGWALTVAIGLIFASRSRFRWAWLAHPAITVLVVVGTANHYWLDALAACLIVACALVLIPGPGKVAQSASGSRHLQGPVVLAQVEGTATPPEQSRPTPLPQPCPSRSPSFARRQA